MQNINQTKQKMFQWIKKNKKNLITAGICIAIVSLMIFSCSDVGVLESLFAKLKKAMTGSGAKAAAAVNNEAVSSLQKPNVLIEVGTHIRNLPKGWHASETKIAQAAQSGIQLSDGQTIVDAYMKGISA